MFQPLSFDDGMQPDATNPDVFFKFCFSQRQEKCKNAFNQCSKKYAKSKYIFYKENHKVCSIDMYLCIPYIALAD